MKFQSNLRQERPFRNVAGVVGALQTSSLLLQILDVLFTEKELLSEGWKEQRGLERVRAILLELSIAN